MNSGQPGISVVVPTHNRVESLARCLARLAAQETEERIEIIVVDDGSDAAEEVAEIVARTPGARLLRQEKQGPAAARNAGVGAARGAIVCFTDDDCEPDPNWVALLTDAIRRGADVAAGDTTNGEAGSWFARASHVQVEYFARESAVPFAASNNIASTSPLLREVPFDSGYKGAAEDRDWCERLSRRGYRIEYVPSASVLHHQRLTLAGYLRKQIGYGRGSWRYHRRAGRRSFERPSFYIGLLRDGFRSHAGIGVLVLLGQAAIAVGYLSGWGRSRSS